MNYYRIPSVTVGLLVRNGEKFISETINSILAQTFKDFELLISDNASTDETERICREYAKIDKRIRYVRQTENIGAIGNFNFLVRLAKGKYFKWAAADDLIAPTFLASCIEVLECQPKFILCHSETVTIGGSGEELPNDIICSSGAAESPLEGYLGRYRPSQRFKDVLLGKTAVMDYWGVIRTAQLRAAGQRLPYIGCEKVFMAKLSLQGRFAEIPEKLFAYRMHPDSFSSQTTAKAQQTWCNARSEVKRYPRLVFLRGYLDAVATSRLSFTERILCYIAIARYLLQVSKWPRVIRGSLFGAEFGEGNTEVLRANVVTQETGIRRRTAHDIWM